jgi:N-acetylglucosamine transport system substrate-binding protein
MKTLGSPTWRRPLAVITVVALAAVCAGPSSVLAASPSADDPFGVEAGEVDVWAFTQAYGHDWIDRAAEKYNEMHADAGSHIAVPVTEHSGEALADLTTRFAAKDPPDVIWGVTTPYDVIPDDLAHDLNDLMAAPSLDDPSVPFGDTLEEGTQDAARYKGRQVAVVFNIGTGGVAFNQALLDENGWEYPETWDEMLALCEEIEATGRACWAYQGTAAANSTLGRLFLPLVYNHGGPEAVRALEALEPGAWQSDAVRAAAADVYALYENGYILDGNAGMTHTQAYTAWAQGDAVFLPGGTFLHAQTQDFLPPDFNMVMKPVPAVANGLGGPGAIRAYPQSLYLVVPKDAKHPNAGKEFIRVLMSQQIEHEFCDTIKVVVTVKGACDGVEFPSIGQSANEMFANTDEYWDTKYGVWYPQLDADTTDYFAALLTGDMTPDEFVDAAQQAADEIAADPDVVKFDPADFGGELATP